MCGECEQRKRFEEHYRKEAQHWKKVARDSLQLVQTVLDAEVVGINNIVGSIPDSTADGVHVRT